MSARLQDARYELLDEMPHVTGGRLFRARDVAFSEIVGVRQLGPGCGLPPEDRGQLDDTVRHLQCLPHPNLVRIYSFDPVNGILVQEWVQGLSLLDLLRRRRELSAAETLRLLAPLPAVLDFLGREAMPVPRPLLGKLFIQFENNAIADSVVAATPIDQWPSGTLKLNPLSLRGLFASASNDATTQTVILDPRQPTDIGESYGPREFARLLYELLGGRIRELDARRYSPIGVLGEAGNAVLRRNLLAMPHADCQALWRDLLLALPGSAPAPAPATASAAPALRALRIPEDLRAVAAPGTGLKLQPGDASAAPIHLVARPTFTVGRSAQMADFLAKILPENEANNTLTNRLSRVHTVLDIADGQLQVRDGNGSGPSLNGSYLDGTPLLPDPPTPLTHRARLRLGEEYALELIALLAAPRTWEIENVAAWSGPQGDRAHALQGALICQPAHGQPVIRHAVWLFTEAGFALDAKDQLVWDTRDRGDSPATFHHHRNSFWLSNRALPDTALACQDTPIRPGEIAPLAPGQTVRLGARTYTVRSA
jgi:hypothetical protein